MVFPEGFPLSQILPIKFIVDQHEFVAKCYADYAELGLEPGNPDDGEWQDAHYPKPNPEGDKTILLLYSDHQQQGLYQSEESGRICFFPGDVKKFLIHGPFVSNWFELWDLYDKWVGERLKKVHDKKDEIGRSLTAMKLHTERNEFGKSVRALTNVKKLHSIIHAERNEFGKSIHSVRIAKKTNAQRWEDPDHPELGSHNPGNLVRMQKRRGYPCGKENRVKVQGE